MNLNLLRPDHIYNSILDIDLRTLYGTGIRGIVIDIDNTLTEWHSPELPNKAAIWLDQAKQEDIRICFVSNNSAGRARTVADRAGVPFVANAQKPRRRSFIRAMEIMGTTPRQTAMIGDQLFTDILGGNRMGLLTILVSPISRREFFGTRLVRLLEAFFIRRLKRAQ